MSLLKVKRMRLVWLVVLCCGVLAGCGRAERSASPAALATANARADAAAKAQPQAEAGATQENPRRYMAYVHTMELNVDEARVAALHQSLEAACRAAVAAQCVILESQLRTGDTVSAELRLRAKPEGVRQVMASLKDAGSVLHQALTAEDLAGPIEDSGKRLEMLQDYRSKLEALRSKPGADIDALIRINKELAEVQGEIESLSGNRARLVQRVDTEILQISIATGQDVSVWRPVMRALDEFAKYLAQGLAALIILLAVTLPWLAALSVLVAIIRWWWKRSKRVKAQAKSDAQAEPKTQAGAANG